MIVIFLCCFVIHIHNKYWITSLLFGIAPLTASTTKSIRFISLLALFIHACSIILFRVLSIIVNRRSSSIVMHIALSFCVYISPRSLSFTLVLQVLYLTVHTTCWSSNIILPTWYRVCLLASGQPIFIGSSQRVNEERFTTSVSILSQIFWRS